MLLSRAHRIQCSNWVSMTIWGTADLGAVSCRFFAPAATRGCPESARRCPISGLLSRKSIRRKAGQKKRENQRHPRVPFFPRDLPISAAVFDGISGIAPLLKLGLIAHPLDRV